MYYLIFICEMCAIVDDPQFRNVIYYVIRCLCCHDETAYNSFLLSLNRLGVNLFMHRPFLWLELKEKKCHSKRQQHHPTQTFFFHVIYLFTFCVSLPHPSAGDLNYFNRSQFVQHVHFLVYVCGSFGNSRVRMRPVNGYFQFTQFQVIFAALNHLNKYK